MDTNLVALNPEALAAVSGMFASDLNTTAGVRMLSTARCKFTIKDGSEEGISSVMSSTASSPLRTPLTTSSTTRASTTRPL